MKLMAHLLAADVRRFRLVMALWVLVAVAAAAVAYWARLQPAMAPRAALIESAGGLIAFAGFLLSCALVPLVIHLHPATGTDAFWMTRPIPPRTLVISKLLLLGVLFIGVPVVIEQVQMGVHAMTAGDMARVAGQTTLGRAVLLAALAVPAVLTPNFARFALLCAGLLFAVAMLPVLVMLVEAWRPPPEGFAFELTSAGPSVVRAWPAIDHTPLIVLAAALAFGGLGVVAIQYHRRRIRDSVALVGAVVVAACTVSAAWPFALIRANIAAPEWATAASALQLHVDPAGVRIEPLPAWSHPEVGRVARMPARLSSAAPGWLASVRIARGELHVESGPTFSTAGYAGTLPDLDGRDPTTVSVQSALEVQRVLGLYSMQPTDEPPGIRLHIPADAVAPSERRTGTLTGVLTIDVIRIEVAATLPLQPGAMYQDGAYRIVIDDVRERGRGLHLQSRSTNVATMFDRRPRPSYSLWLRNTTRGEAVASSGGGGGGFGAMSPAFLPFFSAWSVSYGMTHGFSVGTNIVVFDPGTRPDAPSTIDSEWLRNAELVILRATHSGSIQRPLAIRGFSLAARE